MGLIDHCKHLHFMAQVCLLGEKMLKRKPWGCKQPQRQCDCPIEMLNQEALITQEGTKQMTCSSSE